ncbi:MAG: S41 family peptidase [Thermoanaerobaculia bacterium]
MKGFFSIILMFPLFLYSEYLRYPAPSPDGKMISFSARGDIWVVPKEGGQAHPITTHPAYDFMPLWSSDGKKIAFTSDRYGNDDVFLMDLEKNELKQITFLSLDELLCDISPDGKRVLFSRASTFGFHWQPTLYEVEIDGSTPREIFYDFGAYGSYSPKGNFVGYVPGISNYYNKGYTGSANMDIYLYDLKEKIHKRITFHNGDDVHTLWLPDESGFYYISDSEKVSNLWFYDMKTEKHSQKTFFKDGDITFPKISRNGEIIAFEYKGGIWIYECKIEKTYPLEVSLYPEEKENPFEFETLTSMIKSYSVNEENTEFVFSHSGDLFVLRNVKEAKTKALSEDFYIEENPIYSKDGKAVYFVSNKNGNKDIYKLESSEPKETRLGYSLNYKITQITDSQEDENYPLLSPDGKKILYLEGNGKLILMDLEKKEKKKIWENWNIKTFSFSPDGEWISLSSEDNDYNEDIFIIGVEGGEPVNITRHPAYDTEPEWSSDGKYIAFRSNRENYEYDIFYIWLTKEDEIKSDWEREEEKKEEKVKIKIDFENISLRVHKLIELPGDEEEFVISRDSKQLVFSSLNDGKKDLYIVDRNGKNLKKLTEGGTEPKQITISLKEDWIYFLDKEGKLNKIKKDGSGKEIINFQGKRKLDRKKEREQVFWEAWNILNYNFYDEKFHENDWKVLYNLYFPLCTGASHKRDFYDCIKNLLGELNASHLGIYPAERKSKVESGFLGIQFDMDLKEGGLRVLKVLEGSPAQDPLNEIRKGDVILKIDREKIEKNTNVEKILMDKADKKISLEVKRGKEVLTLGITPVNSSKNKSLLYDDYVKEMRDYVGRISDGNFCYVHIKSMDIQSYERFQRELFSECYEKKGLIVDVRNNGGGWTTDLLLKLLAQKPHAITVPRGGGPGYPDFERKRVFTWKKPFVVLCNQDSFSNAEIFSHAIKTLKLAPLVGVETNGSVISTDETVLVDGSIFRVPSRGWYTIDEEINMEERGAIPDFIVENPREIWGKEKRDLQVEKAVEILKDKIKF